MNWPYEWLRAIPSAPEYYACTDGFIWRKRRAVRKLRCVNHSNGYYRVKLSVQNKQRDAYIHRLVCEAYHGQCPDGMECRHIDGNRKNNRPENLAWSDKATNEADKVLHGTLQLGEHHHHSKLTAEMVTEARRRAGEGETVTAIAADFGIPYRRLLDAVAGRRWKHLGGVPKLLRGAQRWQAERKAAGLRCRY